MKMGEYQQVVLRIFGRQLYIFCPFAEVIPALCNVLTIRGVMKRTPAGMRATDSEAFSLTQRKQGFEILTYVGYVGMVKQVLDGYKIPYAACERVRKSDGSCAEYRLDNLMQLSPLLLPGYNEIQSQLREWQVEAFKYMVNGRFGCIQVSTGGGKSFLITKFSQAAHDIKICVTTGEIADIMELYNSIMSGGCNATLVRGPLRKSQMDARVFCVTTQSAHHLASIPFDVLLGDEVHAMAANSIRKSLWKVWARRAFGFSANVGQRADKGDMWVTGQFGPIILKRTYSENKDAGDVVPIFYRFISTTSSKSIKSSNASVRYRNYIVQNANRNAEIANMARYYVEKGHQVLIMTLTVEHTLRICALLPDAVSAYRTLDEKIKERLIRDKMWRDDFPVKFTNKMMQEQIDKFAAGHTRLAVANRVWWKSKNFPFLTVLIRADAQNTDEACTQIAGRLSRKCPQIGKTHGLLIDCEDEFDNTTGANSRRRRGKYKKLGWKPWEQITTQTAQETQLGLF